MQKEINKIINNWDPVGLANLVSKNEYDIEVNEILEYISNCKNISKTDLAKNIKEIFLKWFGEDIFQVDNETLEKIAEEIINVCGLEKVKQ